jgi:hypothetical protein
MGPVNLYAFKDQGIYFSKMIRLFIKLKYFRLAKMKIRNASKREASPWSLHIGCFWETHIINHPEVQDQVVDLLIYGKDSDDAKVSKSHIWVNRKIAAIVPISALRKGVRYEKYIQTLPISYRLNLHPLEKSVNRCFQKESSNLFGHCPTD